MSQTKKMTLFDCTVKEQKKRIESLFNIALNVGLYAI